MDGGSSVMLTQSLLPTPQEERTPPSSGTTPVPGRLLDRQTLASDIEYDYVISATGSVFVLHSFPEDLWLHHINQNYSGDADISLST